MRREKNSFRDYVKFLQNGKWKWKCNFYNIVNSRSGNGKMRREKYSFRDYVEFLQNGKWKWKCNFYNIVNSGSGNGKMRRKKNSFRDYVEFLQNGKWKWKCKFRYIVNSGSMTRIKAQLAGVGGYGIIACKKVDRRVRSEARKVWKGKGEAESSNGSEGNVGEGAHQLVTANNENAPRETSVPAMPYQSFDGASSSAFLPLHETNVPSQFLHAQNMIPQQNFSLWTQPPQSQPGGSYIQPQSLSYPSNGRDLTPEALTNMPGPLNAEEGEPNTEIPQRSPETNGSLDRTENRVSSENEGRLDNGRSDDDLWKRLNNLPGGGMGDRRIGKIIVSSTELAKGSNGTIVLEGMYEGRFVAVKRLVRAHHDIAFNEIQNLIKSDRHPNIVRYYGVECDQDFVYLALERCTCSLDDLIQLLSESSNNFVFPKEDKIKLDSLRVTMKDVNLWRADGHPSILLLKLMREVVSGLSHLHDLKIIHRDFKPQNVLISNNPWLVAQLSDMGISKCLPDDKSSLGYYTPGCGSSGWRAPEQLRGGRQTRAMDLFSLGCVLFFCITRGRHPFGERLERDINILNNKIDLSLVEFIPEAYDLLSRLLNTDLELRPKASEVLHHPFFWSSDMRLSFLCDISNVVHLENTRASNPDFLNALESVAPLVFDGNWDEKIDHVLRAEIGKRRYDYSLVRDLLRAVRNKWTHRIELPEEVKELFGPSPDGYDNYFAERFPRLLMESYRVACQFFEAEEERFREYFRSDALWHFGHSPR